MPDVRLLDLRGVSHLERSACGWSTSAFGAGIGSYSSQRLVGIAVSLGILALHGGMALHRQDPAAQALGCAADLCHGGGVEARVILEVLQLVQQRIIHSLDIVVDDFGLELALVPPPELQDLANVSQPAAIESLKRLASNNSALWVARNGNHLLIHPDIPCKEALGTPPVDWHAKQDADGFHHFLNQTCNATREAPGRHFMPGRPRPAALIAPGGLW